MAPPRAIRTRPKRAQSAAASRSAPSSARTRTPAQPRASAASTGAASRANSATARVTPDVDILPPTLDARVAVSSTAVEHDVADSSKLQLGRDESLLGDASVSGGGSLPKVGDRIDIWWEHDGTFYSGTLGDIVDKATGMYRIDYDDGEQEVVTLPDEKWRYILPKKKTKKKTFVAPPTPAALQPESESPAPLSVIPEVEEIVLASGRASSPSPSNRPRRTARTRQQNASTEPTERAQPTASMLHTPTSVDAKDLPPVNPQEKSTKQNSKHASPSVSTGSARVNRRKLSRSSPDPAPLLTEQPSNELTSGPEKREKMPRASNRPRAPSKPTPLDRSSRTRSARNSNEPSISDDPKKMIYIVSQPSKDGAPHEDSTPKIGAAPSQARAKTRSERTRGNPPLPTPTETSSVPDPTENSSTAKGKRKKRARIEDVLDSSDKEFAKTQLQKLAPSSIAKSSRSHDLSSLPKKKEPPTSQLEKSTPIDAPPLDSLAQTACDPNQAETNAQPQEILDGQVFLQLKLKQDTAPMNLSGIGATTSGPGNSGVPTASVHNKRISTEPASPHNDRTVIAIDVPSVNKENAGDTSKHEAAQSDVSDESRPIKRARVGPNNAAAERTSRVSKDKTIPNHGRVDQQLATHKESFNQQVESDINYTFVESRILNIERNMNELNANFKRLAGLSDNPRMDDGDILMRKGQNAVLVAVEKLGETFVQELQLLKNELKASQTESKRSKDLIETELKSIRGDIMNIVKRYGLLAQSKTGPDGCGPAGAQFGKKNDQDDGDGDDHRGSSGGGPKKKFGSEGGKPGGTGLNKEGGRMASDTVTQSQNGTAGKTHAQGRSVGSGPAMVSNKEGFGARIGGRNELTTGGEKLGQSKMTKTGIPFEQYRANSEFQTRVCNLVARQVTVCILETPHENDNTLPLVEWLEFTVRRLYEMVADRLRAFPSYALAHHTLSTSLGNDTVELSWFTRPSTQGNILKARRNYMAWDPPPTNEEWESEVILLREIAEAYLRASKQLTIMTSMTELETAIAVAKSVVASFRPNGNDSSRQSMKKPSIAGETRMLPHVRI